MFTLFNSSLIIVKFTETTKPFQQLINGILDGVSHRLRNCLTSPGTQYSGNTLPIYSIFGSNQD